MHPLAALAVVAALATAAPLAAQDSAGASASTVPTVLTSGEAVVRRAPDQAFVFVAVEMRARTPREAQQQNAEAMAGVQQRIVAAGVAKDAVRTTGYSIQQEYDFANGRRTSRGYVARNGVEVRVDAIERMGDLLDLVVEGGATSIGGVRFDLKDRSAAEREALRLAVADARARADAMAAGAGRTIDRVLRIADRIEPIIRPMDNVGLRAASPGAVDSTPIAAGLIEIHARVELTATLK